VSAPKIAVIIPVYEKYLYALRAVESCFKYTSNCLVIVEDDASPDFSADMYNGARYIKEDGSAVHVNVFPKNGGLTRSWNHGLRVARDMGADYCVCGNSDIVFTEGWSKGLIHALNNGYHLVGPLSNAPGTTCPSGRAQVDKHFKGYETTDDSEYLNKVARSLGRTNAKKVIAGPVNGFFQMASLPTWWEKPYDDKNVYSTHGRHRMTGNEDELQRRWRKAGRKTGIALSSFIFHYRAVTRGGRHKKGRWFRLVNPKRDV
jgi:glycosyltransferase involved in cell wall biosynthesis